MSSDKKHTFFGALLVSVLGTGASRVLGAVRDIVMAAVFGASKDADAFFMATTLPNIFRRFVADEGLTGALLPALAAQQQRTDKDAEKELAQELWGFLILANTALCLAGIFLPHYFVDLLLVFSPRSIDPQSRLLLIGLTQVVFSFVFTASGLSFVEALLNHRGHYFLPKLAPGLVSIGIVVGLSLAWWEIQQGMALSPWVQDPIYWPSIGFLVGGVAQCVLVWPAMRHYWGPLYPSFRFRDPALRGVLGEMGKVILIGLVGQLNIFVLRGLAYGYYEGSVAVYWNANRIVDLAQGMIAVAIGSVVLPRLSQAFAQQDSRRLGDELGHGLVILGFVMLPVAIVLGVLHAPIADALFYRGAFTRTAADATGAMILVMIPFLLCSSTINILKRAYFAMGRRWALLGISILGVVATYGFGIYGLRVYGLPGLGLGLGASTCLQALSLLVVLGVVGGSEFRSALRAKCWGLRKCLAGTVAAGMVAGLLGTSLTWSSHHYGGWAWAQLGLTIMLIGGTYIGTARIFAPDFLKQLLRR